MFDLSSSPDFLPLRNLNINSNNNNNNNNSSHHNSSNENNNNNSNQINRDLSNMMTSISLNNNNNNNNNQQNSNQNNYVITTTTTTTTTTTKTTIQPQSSQQPSQSQIALYNPNSNSILSNKSINSNNSNGLFISHHRMIAMHKISIGQKKRDFEKKMRIIEAYNNNVHSNRTDQLLESLAGLKFSTISPSSSPSSYTPSTSPLLIYSASKEFMNNNNNVEIATKTKTTTTETKIIKNKCKNNYEECNSLICTNHCNNSNNNHHHNNSLVLYSGNGSSSSSGSGSSSSSGSGSLFLGRKTSYSYKNSIKNINNSNEEEEDLENSFDNLTIGQSKKVNKKLSNPNLTSLSSSPYKGKYSPIIHRKFYYSSSPSNLSNLF